MTGKDLFIALGDISHKYYDEAEYGTISVAHEHKSLRRPLLIAAVIAMALLLVGCAAVYVLHLQDLKMGDYAYTQPRYIDAGGNKVPETEVVREVISLQGVVGSPNFRASQEWYAFEQEYDTDQTLLSATDEHPFHAPPAYDAYFVYTQEMVDKVDEIAGKYNLDLAGEMVCVEDFEADILFDSLGIPPLHRQGTEIRYAGGYFYSCGNFKMEFFIAPAGLPYEVVGSYRYNGKAYFDVVSTSVSSIENCEEEVYRLPDGSEVLIVMDEENAHIFYDRQDAFVSLSLFRINWNANGAQEYLTRHEVEQIAESFDFTITPQKPDVAKAQQKVEAAFDAHRKEQEAMTSTQENPAQYDSYDSMIRSLLDTGVDAQSCQYALRDITGDGQDELFIGEGGSFGTIVTMKDGKTTTIYSDTGNSGSYLCEGNIAKHCSIDEDGYEHYNFLKYDPSAGYMTQFLSMGYWPESWYYSESFVDFTFISKAEFDEMADSYKVIDIGMKPISEYPFS